MKLDIKLKIVSFAIATVLMLALMFFCLGMVIAYGPSEEAKYIFISKMESSIFTKAIPRLYLSNEKCAEIIASHDAVYNTRVDTSELDMLDSTVIISNNDSLSSEEEEFSAEGIEIINLEKGTYTVQLMIVSDPKRVFVGAPKNGYGVVATGDSVYGIAKSNGALAGISAGGMLGDEGGIPDGAVISNGEHLWGTSSTSYQVAGLDAFGILHVGKMKLEEINNKGIVNAASFGPALIIDGEPQLLMESQPSARSAIGQRADGAIILLTATPLKMDTAGATYNDLISIFTEYNAINAANLYCQDEPTMIFGEKNIASNSLSTDTPVAAAFLVK